MNKENNTYLLGTEDVSEIYNRLLRASHITVCSEENALLTFVLSEREDNVSSTVSEKFWSNRSK